MKKKKKDFPTAPLNDDIWLEEPVPARHLCIHEKSQAKFPLFLSLSIQLVSVTTHSRRHTIIIPQDDGPQ